MASADLREELECSVCLGIYTDPVMLNCGHNFCRVCIDRVLNTQKRAGGYSCPECRKRFRSRPSLQRNIKLCNIAEHFLPSQPGQGSSGIFCAYCIHSSVPAVKSCLLCEASLCKNHLRIHSKSPEHVLCDPSSSLETRKCSIHKKILEYYCTEDSACVCVSCRLDGEHRGHQVDMLDEVVERKKKKMRNDLQKMTAHIEEAEKRLQRLQECRRNMQEEADGETERVTALFRDLRRRLEDLEKRVLNDITRQAEQVFIPLSELIRQLEIKKEELAKKMRHIEELCNMTDPLTVLQEPDAGDLCDTEDRERNDEELRDGGDLDMAAISDTLHAGLSDIIIGVCRRDCIPEAADLILDINTAGNNLYISDDGKTVNSSVINQNRPDIPQRFQYFPQVLSSQNFSSGRHYWEVDVGTSESWRIGVCYPSIDRKGTTESLTGYNNKSWGLYRNGNCYSVIHEGNVIRLPDRISSNGVRVYLDYKAGKISFYELGNLIRHLHTFTATFTEPLHAVLCVWGRCVKLLTEN